MPRVVVFEECLLGAKLDLEEVLKRIRHHHGDRYGIYPESFISGDKPMTFNCVLHGDFIKKPEDFCPPINSKRQTKVCPECAKIRRSNNKKIGLEEFKLRLNQANHKNLKVDFSTFSGISSKVTVTCLIHDFTWKVPAYDIAPKIGSSVKPKGCRKCAGRELEWQEVLELFTKRHGNLYRYFPDTFVNMTTKMKMECPDPSHGELWQTPHAHKGKRGGCQKCGWMRGGLSSRVSPDELLARCQENHSDRFDYSETDFSKGVGHASNAKSWVKIRCKSHPKEIIEIPLEKHISQNHGGCRGCFLEHASKSQRLSRKEFIARAEQVHGKGTYIYDEVHEFKNLNETIQIICPKHGPLRPMTGGNHLMGRKHGPIKRDVIGQGCRKCGVEQNAAEKRMTLQEFLEKARTVHSEIYDYSLVEWVDRTTNVVIICPKHDQFSQKPSDHLSGHGCQKCNIRVSRVEAAWLDSLGVPDEFRQHAIVINGKQMHLDAYDPFSNTAYEFWGDLFHGNPSVYPDPNQITFTKKTIGELYNKTQLKRQLILDAGITLVEIWESEWRADNRKRLST